mgnify:CR=1 FL=1
MWQILIRNTSTLVLIWLFTCDLYAQDASQAFHSGANQYIAGQMDQARETVMEGLKQDPDNKKLQELLRKINKEKEDKQQEQQQQQQQNQEQQQKEQQQEEQNSEQEQNEQEQQQEQEQQDASEEEQQAQEEQRKQEETEQEAKQDSLFMMPETEMKISKEKARMILEALRNNEIQYLQQKQRKARSRSNSGPDW